MQIVDTILPVNLHDSVLACFHAFHITDSMENHEISTYVEEC
jgi:hypothetical protein